MKKLEDLRAGDPCIVRRIDDFGKYSFYSATVECISKKYIRIIQQNRSGLFLRSSGSSTGLISSSPIEQEKLFTVDNPLIIGQMAQLEAGTLAPAYTENQVRFARAFDRFSGIDPLTRVLPDLLIRLIIQQFGLPNDYQEEK